MALPRLRSAACSPEEGRSALATRRRASDDRGVSDPWPAFARPPGLVPLDEAQCAELLSTARTGRLATTQRALPVVAPVALGASEGGGLLVEPLVGHLVTLASDAIVALEVGTLGWGVPGWTVLVQGLLSARTPDPFPDPLNPLPDARYLLRPAVLTGWRLDAARG